MTLQSKAVSGVKWNTLATLIETSLQALRLLVLARLLAPKEFGLMAMAMVVVGFAQAYSDAGISAAIIHRQDATAEQLSSLYWLNILVGILVFVLVYLLTPIVLLFFEEPRLSSLLRVAALTFIISPWGKQFEVLLQKDLRFELLTKIGVVASVLSTIATLITAFMGFGVWALVWGQISLTSSSTSMLSFVGWRQYRPLFHLRRRDFVGYLKFGFYQMGERTLNFFSQRADQLILGSLLGAQWLGYYTFAFHLVMQPIFKVNSIINRVAFPVFAKMQDDMAYLQRAYVNIIKLITTITAPAMIGLAIVCPLAIPLLFGTKWLGSVLLVQILSLVALSRSTGNPVGSLLLAKGRADLAFCWNLSFLLVSIPFMYAGVHFAGGVGVALALLLLQAIFQFPSYFYLIRPMIGSCGLHYMGAIFRPIALSLLMGGVVWLFRFAHFAGWGMLIGQSMVGAIIYASLLWSADRSQIAQLRAIVFNHSRN